jgi:hypothetical protein
MNKIIYKIGTKVRTVDRGAQVHGRRPDKREDVGIIVDLHRPWGRQTKPKEMTPPYYVQFSNEDASWYDADEVAPINVVKGRTKR